MNIIDGDILLNQLQEEMKAGQVVVFLQPQMFLQEDVLCGAEALVRKYDANGELQFPLSFIPLYEERGIIQYLDLFVFEEVCKFIQKYQDVINIPDFRVSVNLSRITILKTDLADCLLEISRKYEVSPASFMLEVTESIQPLDKNLLYDNITSLAKVGFSLSLDDFGIGYSNIEILTYVDFDEIKLDRGIIANINNNKKTKVMIKYIIDSAKLLNDNVVCLAEGIETKDQIDSLKEMQCQKGQGYYLGRPVSMQEFVETYLEI